MENSESSKASKTSSADKAKRAFGQFLFEVASLLTIATVRKLAMVLNYAPADLDEAERDRNPSYVFVKSLREKGIINPTDISTLLDTLKAMGLQGLSNDVLESFRRNLSGTHSPSLLPTNLNEKITSFVAEIKTRYHNLYNGVQPIPYVRDKLICVSQEFIDSGIEFLNKKGANTVWERLESYHCVLTDPRLASTRFILLGEPGFGKSTLALQLVYDWCIRCAESALKNVQILIFLRLRQLSGIKSIFRAIQQFILPHDSQLTISDIKEILCGIKSVVFVLDGFDEYEYKSGHKDDDVTKIISGRMFNEFQVILTTRPSYKPETPTPTTIQLRLTGFDSEAQDKYIRKAVINNDPEAMKKIRLCLEQNPVLHDLCEDPLFFVMFVHIVLVKEENVNFDSVTNYFRYMIACFHEHMKNKITDSKLRVKYENVEKNHRKLDEVAFSAFTGKSQQIVWMKDVLQKKIGEDLYNQCTDVGIFVEEEKVIINNAPGTPTANVIQRVTQTRFFHKLFCEWFAAHFLSSYATERSALDLESTMTELDAFELQYVFRFACGINPNASVKIIKYLQTLEGGDKFAILCILERTGNISDIKESIRQLSREGVIISGHDSLLLQKSSLQLLEIAAKYDIPIEYVYLHNCLQSVDLSASAIRTTSGLALTSRIPVEGLQVILYNREMTEDEYIDILQFSSMCPSLRGLGFKGSAPPKSFKVGPALSSLCSRNVTVKHRGVFKESPKHVLNLLTGRWEREDDGLEATEEDFDRMNLDWAEVQDKTDEDYKRSVQKGREILRRLAEAMSTESHDDTEKDVSRIIVAEPGGQKRSHDFLTTCAVITQTGGVLTINDTGVELHIPPFAFHEDGEKHRMTLRIIPYHSLHESSERFEDHSTVAVEILPDKLNLQKSVKLILPHCLRIRNVQKCNVRIFQSHHNTGENPFWEDITKSVSFDLRDSFCIIRLRQFCWVKYNLGGEEVEGKKLILYASQAKRCERYADVRVGYYLDLAGAKEVFQLNRPNNVVYQSFIFLKEPRKDLSITLSRTLPEGWTTHSTDTEVIKYFDIELSNEQYRPFILQPAQSSEELLMCLFQVSQGQREASLSINMEPEGQKPPRAAKVPYNTDILQELSHKLGSQWKDLGRRLGISDATLSNICANYSGNQQEMAYQMLIRWKNRKGVNFSYEHLEEVMRSASSADLADWLKDRVTLE